MPKFKVYMLNNSQNTTTSTQVCKGILIFCYIYTSENVILQKRCGIDNKSVLEILFIYVHLCVCRSVIHLLCNPHPLVVLKKSEMKQKFDTK